VRWLIRRNFLFTYVLIGFTFVDAAGSGPARIVSCFPQTNRLKEAFSRTD
jgi:hypothetical protein